ncbi:MAG TPA: aminotransferase class III-fold pyridoxal phosphate-dependent enzyme [Candidatus Dormibacteraeota bacterium]|nr:aminotransferase class III-fold pyridoxal phosphate-dependent enzyme [Candidatus Dormibacteraeota bacterium]
MITAEQTSTFPRFLDLAYPSVERGEGVWVYTADGKKILDACSGGAMVANLGHGAQEVIKAGARQAEKIAYFYMDHFTNEPMEQLADRLITTAAPEMARVRFASSGSEANEAALRLARSYHVDRGQGERWRVISPAQSYHGSTMATLGLTGRTRTLQHPYEPYLSPHLHISMDGSGEGALRELDARLEEAGPQNVAAFFCEPISGAARPAFATPDKFWRGLEERRASHGFLICFDEVVTGMGRTGTWFAYQQLPIEPDIVTIGKGLGAGYAPISALLCKQHVYDAIDRGSRFFDLGHTWDGAPISCATGLAVLDALVERRLVERVRERGPRLLADVKSALRGNPLVADVRGRGFLLGISLVGMPDELHFDERVEDAAIEHGLLIMATHSTPDGYAGDEVVFAPAFTSTDDELELMVARLAATMKDLS